MAATCQVATWQPNEITQHGPLHQEFLQPLLHYVATVYNQYHMCMIKTASGWQ